MARVIKGALLTVFAVAVLGACEENLDNVLATPPPGIDGKSFVLTKVVHDDGTVDEIKSNEVTISFESKTKVSGTFGCNDYNAKAKWKEGGILVFEGLALTKKSCATNPPIRLGEYWGYKYYKDQQLMLFSTNYGYLAFFQVIE